MLKEKKRGNRYSLSLTTNTKQLGEKPPQAGIPKGSMNPLGGFKEEHQAQKPSLEEDSETFVSHLPREEDFPNTRKSTSLKYLPLCCAKESLNHEDLEPGFTTMSCWMLKTNKTRCLKK